MLNDSLSNSDDGSDADADAEADANANTHRQTTGEEEHVRNTPRTLSTTSTGVYLSSYDRLLARSRLVVGYTIPTHNQLDRIIR